MEEKNVIIHKEFPPAAYAIYHFQSVLLTKKEQTQGIATMFTLLTMSNFPKTRYLFLLYNSLVVKQAAKSTQVFPDLKRLYCRHNKGPSKVTCRYKELENSPE